MDLWWGVRNLRRHPLRAALSLAGIAVAAAMLLDMVLLSGGIERSFERLLLGRGFQVRISPKGTLPFDTEATLPDASRIRRVVEADPDVVQVAPFLGASAFARSAGVDSLVPVFAYGVDPTAQVLYQLESGRDLDPTDSLGVILSRPAADLLMAGVGDTLRVVGGLDPQVAEASERRAFVVSGLVRWLYDYRGQPSIGMLIPVLQSLSGQRAADRVSAFAVRLRDQADPERVARRLRQSLPQVEVNSVGDLVARFRERLVYFRQLSYILGTISLAVTLLLIGTLLTITVHERAGEIATLRAIGVSRGRVVRMVVAEGAALTLIGGSLGVILGLITAGYLDRILTSFPGLPAAISFFVPERRNLTQAALVLFITGLLAGAYPAWRAASASIAETLRSEAT